jgi:hypothetical protein
LVDVDPGARVKKHEIPCFSKQRSYADFRL